MIVKKVEDKNKWETLLSNCKEKTFLDSWNWGDFEKSMGKKIWRLGLFKEDSLKAISLIIKIKAKRGNFLFLPHGPTGDFKNYKEKEEGFRLFLEKIKEIAQKEKD